MWPQLHAAHIFIFLPSLEFYFSPIWVTWKHKYLLYRQWHTSKIMWMKLFLLTKQKKMGPNMTNMEATATCQSMIGSLAAAIKLTLSSLSVPESFLFYVFDDEPLYYNVRHVCPKMLPLLPRKEWSCHVLVDGWHQHPLSWQECWIPADKIKVSHCRKKQGYYSEHDTEPEWKPPLQAMCQMHQNSVVGPTE